MYQIIILLFLVSSGPVSSGPVSSTPLTEENLRSILAEFKQEINEQLVQFKEELVVHFKQACSKEQMDEIKSNECHTNPCTNNGTCVDGPEGYHCDCLPLTSGLNCETKEEGTHLNHYFD